MLNRLLTFLHLRQPVRAHAIETVDKPRSWWGTGLSVLVHGLIVTLLWSAPAIDINPPEVPPPESIDATILPPPPVEKTTQTPTPSNHTNTPPVTHTANPAPSTAQQSKQLPSSETGTQAQGTGNQDGKSGGANANKPLPSGAPVAVAPSGGFLVNYEVNIEGTQKQVSVFNTAIDNAAHAAGKASLVFNRKGDRYVADLSASASVTFASAKIRAHSEGQVRSNTLATERFDNTVSVTAMNDKQSSFAVDYANKQAVFTNNGNSVTRGLTQDPLFDFVSVMAYMQAGFQQGSLSAGQGALTIPIGKRDEIDGARITIGNYERISTYESSFDAIPVNITINSGSIKYIRVWFVADKKYLPLQMDIGVDKYQILLRSRNSD
jgi:hypothetical protein